MRWLTLRLRGHLPGRAGAGGSGARIRLWAAFAVLLAMQVLLALRAPENWHLEASPGTPPAPGVLRLASLDEPILAAYATDLVLQGYDAQAGALLPLRSADFPAIRQWLELAFALNAHSSYPLMLAAFDYAETAHAQDELRPYGPPQAPAILDFVERGFRADPAAHWRWLAHAAWVSRYVLHEDARAMAEAHLLRAAPASANIPAWARELDTYVLGRKDGIDARRALLGGLAAGSPGTNPADLERLAGRISAMPGAQTDAGAAKP
jgi:hypothetical protein